MTVWGNPVILGILSNPPDLGLDCLNIPLNPPLMSDVVVSI